MLHGLHLGDWKKNLHRTEVLCRQQRSPFPPEEFAVLDLTAWILVTCPWASKNTPKWRFGWLKHLISRDIEVILWRSYGDFLKSYGKLNTTTLQFGDDSAIHFWSAETWLIHNLCPSWVLASGRYPPPCAHSPKVLGVQAPGTVRTCECWSIVGRLPLEILDSIGSTPLAPRQYTHPPPEGSAPLCKHRCSAPVPCLGWSPGGVKSSRNILEECGDFD